MDWHIRMTIGQSYKKVDLLLYLLFRVIYSGTKYVVCEKISLH